MTKTPILRTVAQVRAWRNACRLQNQSVGFVPTMGALHAGHCSLMETSAKENDRSVVSIFVNPSQFAPHEDLDSYPRTLESDLEIISKYKVDAVFVPKISEVYPAGITTEVKNQRGAFVTVHGCSEQLEGASRPQFFRGVATVVSKLLNIVQPTRVYFGQKDAQQCVVIRNLVRDLLFDTEVKTLPTMREPNGLAMSSRNAYLSSETKEKSSVIFRSLTAAEEYYTKQKGPVPAEKLIEIISRTLNDRDTGFVVEYLAVSHPDTLEDLDTVEPGVGAIISTAVCVPRENSDEKTRLIDNVVLH